MKAWLLKPVVPRYAFIGIWLLLIEQLYVNHRTPTWSWAGVVSIAFMVLIAAALTIRRATVHK